MAAKKKAVKKATGMAAANKPGKRTAGGTNKTAFVRGLPADMSAKDVVATGKKQGIVLSEAYVYKIRSESKRSDTAPPAGAKATPATTPQSGSAAGDFVRSLPVGTRAKEAVEQAKAKGIRLTTGYFYTLRSNLGISGDRKVSSAAPAAKARPGTQSRGAAAPIASGLSLTSSNPSEQAVLDALAALGVGRVREIVATVERLQRS